MAPSRHHAMRTSASPVDTLLATAARHQLQGNRSAAAATFKQVLAIAPDHALALNGLGNLAAAARDHTKAIDLHKRAAKAEPRNPKLQNDLANSLIVAGSPQDAIRPLRRALELDSTLKPALFNLARAQRNLNQAERALATLDRLETLGAPKVDVDLERAVVLAQSGDGDAAAKLFRSVLSARPNDVRALSGLAGCRRATADENDLAAVDRTLSGAQLEQLHTAVLQRAAGKILEDLGRFDDAFERYARANSYAAAKPFDMDAHLTFVEKSKRLFSPEFFVDRSHIGHPSDRPIFVVGMPRSGTTLVEQVLASHPDVAGLGEITDLERGLRGAIASEFGSEAFFENLAALTKGETFDIASAYLEGAGRRAGTSARFIDKVPHNFLLLGWIALAFPNARIIHCARDARDICVSCFTQVFAEAHTYSADLRTMGAYYRAYEDLMAHWETVLPNRIRSIRYEKFIADLEPEARSLVADLGLEWSDACLEFHRNKRVVQTPSQWQVRQPVYTTAVGRWRRFENHLKPLFDALASDN